MNRFRVPFLLTLLAIAMSAHAQTVTLTLGDIDGFGFGTAAGGNVPSNVFNNTGGSDPAFMDRTIPDTGGSTSLSFTFSFGQTFTSVTAITLTMGLQEFEQLGNHLYLDGVEIVAPLSAYSVNGNPLTEATNTNFFDTIISQGDFQTDRVSLVLPASYYSLLTDGEGVFSIVGTGESFAIDFAQLQVTAIPEPGAGAALFGSLALGVCVLRRKRIW